MAPTHARAQTSSNAGAGACCAQLHQLAAQACILVKTTSYVPSHLTTTLYLCCVCARRYDVRDACGRCKRSWLDPDSQREHRRRFLWRTPRKLTALRSLLRDQCVVPTIITPELAAAMDHVQARCTELNQWHNEQ